MKNKDLHNIKKSGFKVPKNYFEDFDTTFLDEAKLKSTIHNSGFKVPKDYFDSFESKVLTPKQKEVKIISIFNRKNLLLVSSVAATIVLFFSLNIFKATPLSITDLDTETVDDYILNEIEITELAVLFSESELNTTQFIEYNISDETLDSYLESVEVNELFLE